MLALVNGSTFVKLVSPGGWFGIPGVWWISPAKAGWSDYGHALVPVVPAAEPPKWKRRVGGASYVVASGVCTEVYQLVDVPAPTIAELLAHLADIRWQWEVGGTVWVKDDVETPISTDRESQSKMMAEMLAVSLNIRQDGATWKFADGISQPVANADMAALALTARAHVANSFTAEGVVQAQIAGSLITTIEQVDAAFAAAVAAA